MAISLKHAFNSPVADAGDPNEVGPNEWNAEHLLTMATARMLGRVTAGTGAAEELTPAQARSVINVAKATIGCTIDGGGAVITTGIKGDVVVPFKCTITGVTMLADQSGSAVVDIWKDTYANYPATDADSITASAPPTISAAVKSQDTTLTGWTTTLNEGDVLRFNVDSCSTIQRINLVLSVTRAD